MTFLPSFLSLFFRDIMIFMDGNGELGILGEEKSRNGKMLENVFLEQNLYVMNRSDKCMGKITRQNETQDEKWAIDFVLVDESLIEDVISMEIDEAGLFRLSGQKDSDHNTIFLKIKMNATSTQKPQKVTQWRLNAPEKEWQRFRHESHKLEPEIQQLFSSETPLHAR